MTSSQITARLSEIDKEQETILAEADKSGGGKLTASQRERYDRLSAEFKMLSSRPLPRKGRAEWSTDINTPVLPPEGAASPSKTRWVDCSTGKELATFAPGERFATSSTYDESEQLSFGRYLVGAVTGDWRNSMAEHRAASYAGSPQGSNDANGSRFIIPDSLATEVIDLARAATVVTRWGATSLDMPTEVVNIAGVASDASYSVVEANNEVPESAVGFRKLMLVAKKVGTRIRCSRELIEDSPNAPDLLEQTLRAGLGVELDRLFLLGNGGSDGISGIVSNANIGNTGSVGSIAWGDLHTAAVGIRALNHQPNAYIISPTNAGALDVLVDGQQRWLGPPDSVAPLKRLETTGIGDATALVGDGSRIIVGVRRAVEVQTSFEADTSFQNDQVQIRITTRVDLALTHPAAFWSLTGIS